MKKDTATKRTVDLGKGAILPLLLKMAWPSITAMLAMAVYNLIETFWLARFSPQALAALTVCFPIQMVFGAIGVGTGAGAGSLAARMFGSGNDRQARQTAGQVVFLSIILGILIILPTVIYPDPILRFFGVTDEIIPLARQYLVTIVLGSPFLLFMMMANNLLRSEGRPIESMTVVLAMSLIGAMLGPVLIFGLGPFPRMGILGAAIAAVISYAAAGILSLIFLSQKTSKYDMNWRYITPNFSIIYAIYQTGFPSLIMNLVFVFVMIAYNHVLAAFGPMAIASLGICFRINGIVVMTLFGIGHGVMPIVGFNMGAGHYERVIKTVRVAVKWTAVFCLSAYILIEVFAHQIIMLFTNDASLIEMAVPALRIYVSMLLFIGPNLIWISMFIGLGKGFTAMVLLLIRDAIFLLPMLYLMPLFFGINGVWSAQPLSNLLAFFIIACFVRREFNSFSR